MPSQTLLDSTGTALRAVRDVDVASLARNEELGKLSFQSIVPQMRLFQQRFASITIPEIDHLPDPLLAEVRNAANHFNNYVGRIRQYDPNTSDASRERLEILQAIDSVAYEIATALSRPASLLLGLPDPERPLPDPTAALNKRIDATLKTFDSKMSNVETEARHRSDAFLADLRANQLAATQSFEAVQNNTRDSLNQARAYFENARAELQLALSAANDVLSQVRQTAAQKGVSQQAEAFRGEAESHAAQATGWLKTSTVLVVLMALFAVGVLLQPFIRPIELTSSYQLVQLTVSKALVLAVLSFATLTATKNYQAHRHNSVVNKHRQNALVTFEALVKAAGDKSNSDIVLTKAAECIFSPQPTGYIKGETADSGLSLINVSPNAIKSIGSGS